MHFSLVDRVVELTPDRIVTLKAVSGAEEYLQDHFPSFPVLPGVLMLESLVQAARRLLSERDPAGARYVLHWAKAVRYGSFVRPGEVLRVEVVLTSAPEGSPAEFRGQGQVIRPASGSDDPPTTTVSGRFALGPCRVRVPSGNGAHAHP